MIKHHATCTPHYPEKVEGEAPQDTTDVELGDGTMARTCVDCGAFEIVPDPNFVPKDEAPTFERTLVLQREDDSPQCYVYKSQNGPGGPLAKVWIPRKNVNFKAPLTVTVVISA